MSGDCCSEKSQSRNVVVQIKRVHPNAQLPTYTHKGDAGMDVYAPETFAIYPHTKQTVRTGICVGLPDGWELQVRPRSGISAKTWARISNSPGTVDTSYTEQIGIIMENQSEEPIYFKKGDRIAQLVLAPVYTCRWVEVDELTDLGRGAGFGSSGR